MNHQQRSRISHAAASAHAHTTLQLHAIPWLLLARTLTPSLPPATAVHKTCQHYSISPHSTDHRTTTLYSVGSVQLISVRSPQRDGDEQVPPSTMVGAQRP
eukprot:CAMPEP_0119540542 /NCGR_PEP_ID=MMETSP1344-20130328/52400_1 /TAXON_ID=236787 /ORGANISM="Florenciella parvula, Strain CCMP2471" /LENGTH=100 /DNA_ID=CAMNT_0007584317 /DNA_START=104 /DNA_END=403 /DNA_ORIENTATION=+